MKKRKLENKTMDGFIIYIKTYELEAGIWDVFFKATNFRSPHEAFIQFCTVVSCPHPLLLHIPICNKNVSGMNCKVKSMNV